MEDSDSELLDDSGENEIQETGSTIMLIHHPSMCCLSWKTSVTPSLGPQDDVEVTKTISTSRDLNEFPLESRKLSYDTINTMDAPKVARAWTIKTLWELAPARAQTLKTPLALARARGQTVKTLGTHPSLSMDHVDTVGALPSQSTNRKDTMFTTPGVWTMKTTCMSLSGRTLTIKTLRQPPLKSGHLPLVRDSPRRQPYLLRRSREDILKG